MAFSGVSAQRLRPSFRVAGCGRWGFIHYQPVKPLLLHKVTKIVEIYGLLNIAIGAKVIPH
jgi:hypothetical protein